MSYTAAVITVSDKGARNERIDLSGPAICEILNEKGWNVVHTNIIPDEKEEIERELLHCSDDLGTALVLTTGGTGFSPRDITPEATLAVVERRTPGIPEAMRAESMRITTKGCLSRSEAGIRKRTLIVNLPGSRKAAVENLMAVVDAIEHGVEMMLGSGSADCGEVQEKKMPPSMEEWLREAKKLPEARKIGMYLTHNGVVRETARERVRNGNLETPDVRSMQFSYDAGMVEQVINDAYKMDGIYYIRVWLNEGELEVGDDIMYVLIGGDIRPHVVDALQYLVGRIKGECVREQEIFSQR